MWPLIKQVRVRCKSRALETGAILVDLPGTQDANTARGAIAKDYMKKANCIWILAPITRAVDDKTAKGSPNKSHHITTILISVSSSRFTWRRLQDAVDE